MGDLQIFDLADLIKKHALTSFVESGTLYGDGLAYAARFNFLELHSIEIVSSLVEAARKRFIGDKRIEIHSGASVDILPILVDELLGPTLFWLDGHFPGGDARIADLDAEKDQSTRLPLRSELEIIAAKRASAKDYIICDDLWLYEDGPYPAGSFDAHMQACFPGKGYSRKTLLGDQTLDFVPGLFQEHNIVKKVDAHQGYLLIVPK